MRQLYLERNMSNQSMILMKNACADVHRSKKFNWKVPFLLSKYWSMDKKNYEAWLEKHSFLELLLIKYQQISIDALKVFANNVLGLLKP